MKLIDIIKEIQINNPNKSAEDIKQLFDELLLDKEGATFDRLVREMWKILDEFYMEGSLSKVLERCNSSQLNLLYKKLLGLKNDNNINELEINNPSHNFKTELFKYLGWWVAYIYIPISNPLVKRHLKYGDVFNNILGCTYSEQKGNYYVIGADSMSHYDEDNDDEQQQYLQNWLERTKQTIIKNS